MTDSFKNHVHTLQALTFVFALLARGSCFGMQEPDSMPELQSLSREFRLLDGMEESIRDGDIRRVKELLFCDDASPCGACVDGTPFLLKAIELRRNDIAEALIENGADIGCSNGDGYTPLGMAMQRRNASIGYILFRHMASTPGIFEREVAPGFPALHFAARLGLCLFANNILKKVNFRENVDKVYGNIGTPLHAAIEHFADSSAVSRGADDLRQLLIGNTDVSKVNGRGETPLVLARSMKQQLVTSGVTSLPGKPLPADHSVVTYMDEIIGQLERRHQLLAKLALEDAACEGDACRVEELLREGFVSADPSYGGLHNGRSPLWLAVNNKCGDAAEVLLEHGANPLQPDHRGMTPFMLAVEGAPSHRNRQAQGYLQQGGEPEDQEQREILKKIREGYEARKKLETRSSDLVKMLLARMTRLEVNREYSCGPGGMVRVTPLHAAVQCNNADTARLLLNAGADPNVRFGSGQTLLHLVAYRGQEELAALLISAGADVNTKNDDGITPLDEAEAGRKKRVDGWEYNPFPGWMLPWFIPGVEENHISVVCMDRVIGNLKGAMPTEPDKDFQDATLDELDAE